MRSLTIGLIYETFETYPPRVQDPPDAHVEFEPESTIEALEEAIEALGHRPVRLGSPHALLQGVGGDRLPDLDAAFNLAEGFQGRNREAWAPVLLEMTGIPTIGSDALSLSLSLDKAWANRWVAMAGVPVALQTIFSSEEEARSAALPADFPLFVKPRWEGTAKGIRPSSRVQSRDELIREVARIVRDYEQPALVEQFLPGAEYTVSLIGNGPPRILPAIQRALDTETRIGVHALEGPGNAARSQGREHVIDGVLEPTLEARMGELALRAFECLECRDFARVDFRLDGVGEPIFLEINPLPTFAIDGTFAILAELEGCSLAEMLGRCVSAGLDRLGLSGFAPVGPMGDGR
jgi:D-alanine-D-alanine ligase